MQADHLRHPARRGAVEDNRGRRPHHAPALPTGGRLQAMNIFWFAGDMLHLTSIMLLLFRLHRSRVASTLRRCRRLRQKEVSGATRRNLYLQLCNAVFLWLQCECRVLQSVASSSCTTYLALSPRSSSSRTCPSTSCSCWPVRAGRSGSLEPSPARVWTDDFNTHTTKNN